MKTFLTMILALFLGACSLKPIQVEQSQYFILKSDEKISSKDFKSRDKSLKILNPDVPLYLNSYQIIYIQNGISNAYAHHFWGDVPSNLYRFVLLSKFEQSGIFKSLVGQNSPVLADFILEGRFDSFEQIIDKKENYAKLALSLNLVDVKQNKIIAHKNFIVKENIAKIDINETLKAFEKALNKLTNEIVVWVDLNLK
ncbi:MAG: membrane integrity-associated transporter subunit PqiC [Campylobacter sp.]|nr:membrane integrity-associated transporter subunit PqiC [Campylobacter sp.]